MKDERANNQDDLMVLFPLETKVIDSIGIPGTPVVTFLSDRRNQIFVPGSVRE